MRSDKKKKRGGLALFAVAVLLLCGVMVFQKNELLSEKQALEKQHEELTETYRKEQERAAFLSDRFAYMQTIRYIEETAREKLGLVYQDEIIFRQTPEE